MFKVMIVEDEMWVRLGLKNAIAWSNYNMVVTSDCSNGKEALEIYQSERPDLIITDLHMPEMDGMTFIRSVREKDKQTKIVILTCLEEFGLAREAMKLDVSDYILKLSMKPEEMEAILEKVKLELEQGPSAIERQATQNLDVLKENLLKDYLFRDRYSEEEFTRAAATLNLNIKPNPLFLCVMEISHYDLLKKRFKDEHGQLTRMTSINVLEEILKDYGRGECCQLQDNHYMLLLTFSDIRSENDRRQQLEAILFHIKRVMNSYFNIQVHFAVSQPIYRFALLKAQYELCINLLKVAVFGNVHDILYVQGEVQNSESASYMHKFDVVIGKCGRINESIMQELEKKVAWLAETEIESKADLHKIFIHWLHLPLSGSRFKHDKTEAIVLSAIGNIQKCENLDEMVVVFELYLDQLIQTETREDKLSPKVIAALEFIESKYNEQITLKMVADHIEVSPNYLTSLIKKDMDTSFIVYLIRYRLEKAKELLLTSELRSYDIAQRVGFLEHSHFSRTFKKLVGFSPSEFRKTIYGRVIDYEDDDALD